MNCAISPPAILMYVASEDGHRGSYLSSLGNHLNGARSRNLVRMLFSPIPLLFVTIEGSFGTYCFAALLRTLMGRRTAGLLLRPGPAVNGRSFRLRLKRLILKLLRRLSQVQTLTILPFAVEPRFVEIADGWIYGPELWDLSLNERHGREMTEGALCTDIRRAAAGRRVCCAVGRQSKRKGFGWFTDLYAKDSALRSSMLFAFGGNVSGEVAAHLANFEHAGGYACNRFITDAELLDLYAAADLIWCVYDADYDQASGILGRAAQLGVPVVVRRGSLVHQMCEIEKLVHIAIEATMNWWQVDVSPPREDREKATARAHRMGEVSLRRLREALGVTINEPPMVID